MMGLKTVWIFVFILFHTAHSNANKIVSITDGNWEDSTVWSGGNLPGVSTGDTVEINHCIFYNENLQLDSGSFVTIKDSGKICGHYNIYLKPGSELDIFGRIYFDTIFVQGYLYIKNNNQAWIGHLIQVTGGGHSLFTGPAVFSYCPFVCTCDSDCTPPPPQDTLNTENISPEIEVHPNPFMELIYVKSNTDVDYINLTDAAGRLIIRKKFNDNFLHFKNLDPGTYFLNFVLLSGERIIKKIVKL